MTLGFGAALTHLLRAALGHIADPATADELRAERVELQAAQLTASGAVPASGTETDPVPEVYPAASAPAADASVDRLISWLTSGGTAVPKPPAGLDGHGHAARELFAADLAVGEVPSIRAIRSGLSVGQDRAQQVQAYLRETTRT